MACKLDAQLFQQSRGISWYSGCRHSPYSYLSPDLATSQASLILFSLHLYLLLINHVVSLVISHFFPYYCFFESFQILHSKGFALEEEGRK